VIAIIAILAGMLFPVLAQAREKARGATCQSNLKQLGSAYMMYVQDYDDQFPLGAQAPDRVIDAYYSPSNLLSGRNSAQYRGWYDTQGPNAVHPYTRNYDIWACPSTDPA